jgi:hypothetical protein
MNSQTSLSRADLEHAEALLREILVEDFEREAKTDAGSLQRMLVHLVNMHVAVTTSPELQANAAKRLGDFAVTTTRMTVRNPEVAPKLNRLSHALRTASERLAGAAHDVSAPAPGSGDSTPSSTPD